MPIFFPAPPETPRLQFLKSFSGPEYFGTAKTSALERFVLGTPETMDDVVRPYGMAMFEGRLYVCDAGRRTVEVFDLKSHRFRELTKDRRLTNPVNIFIGDNGAKYVTDPTAGAVFVFGSGDNLIAILGKDSNISPIDVAVRGQRCYVTDFISNQVVVLDVTTGREIARIGRKSESTSAEEPLENLAEGEFSLISDLALDQEGNIYVTDKAGARITVFDESGTFKQTIGRLGLNINEFARPKGIAIDKDDRIWVVDAGTEVTKIYNQKGQLLLFFGLPGNEPGMMNLPAKVILDYDNVELFRKYAVEGAEIEFLVLITNQYGPNKISVYGFGNFPIKESIAGKVTLKSEPGKKPESQISRTATATKLEPEINDSEQERRNREIAEIYYQSMGFYRTNQLEKAREGFIKVINSGLVPTEMARTIETYLTDINNRLGEDEQKKEIVELYYQSMEFYRSGQLEKARPGFVRVMNSGLIPAEMIKTIQSYLKEIDKTLAKKNNRSQ